MRSHFSEGKEKEKGEKVHILRLKGLISFPKTNNEQFCLFKCKGVETSRVELREFKSEARHRKCSHLEVPNPVVHTALSRCYRIVPPGLSQLAGYLFSPSNLWHRAVEIIQCSLALTNTLSLPSHDEPLIT